MAYDKVAYEPHPVSVERKRELNEAGFRIIDARFAPGDIDDAEADDTAPLSDDELRAAIEDATGKAPHHKTGRVKLIEQYRAIGSSDDHG